MITWVLMVNPDVILTSRFSTKSIPIKLCVAMRNILPWNVVGTLSDTSFEETEFPLSQQASLGNSYLGRPQMLCPLPTLHTGTLLALEFYRTKGFYLSF